MTTRKIAYTVRGQRITTAEQSPAPVTDSRAYLTAQFTVDEAWAGLRIFAVFFSPAANAEPVLLDAHMACPIPPVVLEKPAYQFSAGLVGYGADGYRLTTDTAEIDIDPSCWHDGKAMQVRPDTYAEVLQLVREAADSAEAAKTSASDAADSAEDAARLAGQAGERADAAAGSASAAALSAEGAADAAQAAADSADAAAQNAQKTAADVTAAGQVLDRVHAAGEAQVTAVSSAGAEQVTAVSSAGTAQTTAIAAKGAEQLSAVADAGAAQVQAAIAAGDAQIAAVGEAAEEKMAELAAQGAVLYSAAQTLNGTEMEQARRNIGAADARANDGLLVPLLIAQYGVRAAFALFVQNNAEQDNLTRLTGRFFAAAAAAVKETYTSKFYRFAVSESPFGEKLDDNAGLTCIPSTNTVAGQDDYATLPLFACFDCNYTIDAATLEPVIHAIKDVAGEFDRASDTQLVGVLQMTGWVKRTLDETTKTVSYRAQKTPGYAPLPEGVRALDNSVRPFVIHAKYAAGLDASGRLTSKSGVQPATLRTGSEGSKSISYSGQRTLWRNRGTQYGGSCLCELAFCQLMLELKYATLSSRSKLAGCNACYATGTITAAETGVRRAIVSNADAEKFLVGSRVSIGTTDNRGAATGYDVADISTIRKIETYDENNKAIYLDTPAAFDTSAGLKILTQPWATGACDNVLGNDGSPFSNTSGKEPYILQGIELQLGVYEALGDTGLYANGTTGYEVYSFRTCAARPENNLKSAVGAVNVGLVPNDLTTAAWNYNQELNWGANNQERYMLAQEFGASSSTGYGAATYREAMTNVGEREWMAFGDLSDRSACGLSTARLMNALVTANWTIGARASGTGGNRGAYTPA